jgi:hypothetical protein
MKSRSAADRWGCINVYTKGSVVQAKGDVVEVTLPPRLDFEDNCGTTASHLRLVRNASLALMGSSSSKEQAQWIIAKTDRDGTVWVMTDGDDAGRRCAGNVFVQIGAERIVRYVKLADDEQPTDWTPEDIFGLFGEVAEESGNAGRDFHQKVLRREH